MEEKYLMLKGVNNNMKRIINMHDFQRAFVDMERDNHFSYEGLKALFEYLEEYEDSCETELELDVIALCCDFTEYDNLKEFQNDYSEDYKSIEDIEHNTTVIPIDNESFIIQQF